MRQRGCYEGPPAGLKMTGCLPRLKT